MKHKYKAIDFHNLCIEEFGEELGIIVKKFYRERISLVQKGYGYYDLRIHHLNRTIDEYDLNIIKKAIIRVNAQIDKGNTYTKIVSARYFETVLERLKTNKSKDLKSSIIIDDVTPLPHERVYDDDDGERFNWEYKCSGCGGHLTPWETRCDGCRAALDWKSVVFP